ncbi:MAG: tRNA lysidine(34) synthetase TilS [Negativicutes bacterium]|nr:tRNA lysidine(34) synthetase TilS [Negativicutes bacterium]
MLAQVKTWIEKHRLLEKGDVVLAACSGGPDSVALVHLLYVLRGELEIDLAVAHVNHRLRGRESGEDAGFVAEFCRELGVPLYSGDVDVRGMVQAERLSVQEAARILRLDFLHVTARRLGGAKIATGHHADDQAETVLLNLLRGAGSAGLSGMRPAEGGIIRPLLSVDRRSIEAYCRENRLAYRIDSSNLKTDYRRNRIRLELLPYLEEHFNPAIRDALCRTALLAADEHDYVHSQAKAHSALTVVNGVWRIDKARFRLLPPALKRENIRHALQKSKGHLKGIGFEHVERLIDAAQSGAVGAIFELPGKFRVFNTYEYLEFGWKPTVGQPTGDVAIAVPGTTDVPGLGISVTAELFSRRPPVAVPMQAVFDLAALELPLVVRTRRAGDRFQPDGMHGWKKLKDFFIDLKIPREKREQTAIFSDRQGIIWIGGYRQARRGKICGNTQEFLRLTINKREDIQHDG